MTGKHYFHIGHKRVFPFDVAALLRNLNRSSLL